MRSAEFGRPVRILLVEDNPGDVRLTEEAFRENKIRNELYIARDGLEAMAFLQRTGPNTDAPRPDIILLDLNLPRMDGREVLEQVKADTDLKSIPVVILTTSKAEEDIIRTYNLHANCYINKPVELEQFICVVKAIESFWLTIVMLPSGQMIPAGQRR